ncbi:MAG: hypothetical protein ACOC5T_08085 [Elusimicrobiota bacterium]
MPDRTDRDILIHILYEIRSILYEDISKVLRIQLETLKKEIEQHLEMEGLE